MHIVLLTPYFAPEVGAPQQIYAEWVPRLVARGHKVTVVTTYPNYPSGKVTPEGLSIPTDTTFAGARVLRVPALWVGLGSLATRMVLHVSFALSLLRCFGRIRDVDLVISHSPPIFVPFSGALLAKLWGARHWLYAHDLWAEAGIEMGMLRSRAFAAILRKLDRLSNATAEHLVCTSPSAVAWFRRAGAKSVSCAINAVDVERFSLGEIDRRRYRHAIRLRHGWADQFVVMYFGTVGYAQGLAHALDAFEKIQGNARLVLIGGGAEFDRLRQDAAARGLHNVEFLDTIPPHQAPAMLSAADVGLFSLRPIAAFAATMPSKLGEYLASGLPVLAGAEGDAAEIVRQAQGGMVYAPGCADGLRQAVVQLETDVVTRTRMSRFGQAFARRHMSRSQFVETWERLLRTRVTQGVAPPMNEVVNEASAA